MPESRWSLDELAYAGPEHLDEAYVATYDAKAGFDWTDEIVDLQRLGLNERSTVVDLGTGTGGFALAVAKIAQRVVAVDVSPAMLAFVQSRANQSHLNTIVTVQAGMLTYEHDGAPADLVYSRHAMHHLPDFWKALALRHIASILRPGGILRLRDLIFSCPLADLEPVIEEWLASASTQTGLGWSRDELETHLREEYSTFSWLLEPMIEQAGFSIVRVEHSDSRIFSDYVCVRK